MTNNSAPLENDGLFISFDEESNTFTIEWDGESHPEYNLLHLMTPEEFSQAISDRLQQVIDDETSTNISSWGQSGGEAEVNDDPEFEEGVD
jgi:hypothetical protein